MARLRAWCASPLFNPTWARRRMSGSVVQSIMNSERSMRPTSRRAAAAAAVNRNPTICADNGTTRSPGSGAVAPRNVQRARAQLGIAVKWNSDSGDLEHGFRRSGIVLYAHAPPATTAR